MNLNARVYPNASAAKHVLVLHGLFGASDNLMRLSKHLHESFAVHALDLRNHGASPHSDEMNYPAMVGDVKAYLESENISSVAIVGHSMGGKVAMAFALTYPDMVERLIVADIAPVTYAPGHTQIFKGLHAVLDASITSRAQADEIMAHYVDDLGVRQFLLKNLKRNPDNNYIWRFSLDALYKHYTSILAFPVYNGSYAGRVLFIAGEHSDYIQSGHRDQVTAYFPNANLKVIQGTSHWLHAEKPEVFNTLCSKFLTVS